MTKDYFKDSIKDQFKLEGNNMYGTNAEFIIDGINNSTDNIMPINLNNIEAGKFYFIFYNLSGKSTNMEKFNPLFVIDTVDMDNTRYIYGVSINFLPVTVRTVFFNNLCNFNLSNIEKNLKVDLNSEYAFENINFANIYKLLYSIGFEWSIRRFDCKLVNKTINISTDILPKFITMSTVKMTGVDDLKLIDIWHKKIQEQEERHKKLLKEILGDYKKMDKELTDNYNTTSKNNDNLEKSLALIKKIF